MKIEKDIFTEKYLLKLFNKIQPNEDGTITYKQIQDFMRDKDDLVLPDRIRNVVDREAELKGDEKLHLKDFMAFITNEKYRNRFEKYLNIYMNFLIPPLQPQPADAGPSVLQPQFEQKYSDDLKDDTNRISKKCPRRPSFHIAASEGGRSSAPQPQFDLNIPPSPHSYVSRPSFPPCTLYSYDVRRDILHERDEDLESTLEDDEDRQRIYHFWPVQLTMIFFSLSEIILYTIDTAYGLNWRNGIIAKELLYNPSRRIEMWRYLSYMFVHSGIWHLSMNIIFQLFLGYPLELIYGWWPVNIVYCCGVISGSLGSSVTNSYAWLAGASGGVYALLTAHIVSLVMNWNRINHRKYLLVFLLGLIFIDIIRVITDYLLDNLDNTISHASHFFGGISGVLIGTVVFQQVTPKGQGKRLVHVLVIISIILAGSAVLYNIFSTDKFPKQSI